MGEIDGVLVFVERGGGGRDRGGGNIWELGLEMRGRSWSPMLSRDDARSGSLLSGQIEMFACRQKDGKAPHFAT